MRTQSRSILLWPILIFSALAGWGWYSRQQPAPSLSSVAARSIAARSEISAPEAVTKARQLSFRVLKSYPHDRNAYTQGLLWHDGHLYESTGREGHSSVRRVELESGKVLQLKKLPAEVFGEGLVLWSDRLIQITWQSGRAFVFDRETFAPKGEWKYQGEGWGLTTDGKSLIMSDGSSSLTFRDPQTFREIKTLPVTFNGKALEDLNELEYIGNQVWANVWKTDYIVCINPQTGVVENYLDCSGLLDDRRRRGGEDVLNGIAYDTQNKRIFLTGKLWPLLFEIKLN